MKKCVKVLVGCPRAEGDQGTRQWHASSVKRSDDHEVLHERVELYRLPYFHSLRSYKRPTTNDEGKDMHITQGLHS